MAQKNGITAGKSIKPWLQKVSCGLPSRYIPCLPQWLSLTTPVQVLTHLADAVSGTSHNIHILW
jgi:hypothetical protein